MNIYEYVQNCRKMLLKGGRVIIVINFEKRKLKNAVY